MNNFKTLLKKDYVIISVLFFVLPYLLFWKLFFGSEVAQRFLGNDFVMYFTAFSYTAERLAQFEFPFWNPHHFQGSPFFARMDLAVLYPFNLIAILIKNIFSLNIYGSYLLLESYMLFHLSLGGIFLYFLAREYKISRLSSFVSGLVFMFSGTALSMLNAVPLITSLIWLPLIQIFYLRYLKGNNTKLNYLLTILFVSISHFAGYLQHTLLYNGFYLGILLAFFLVSEKKFTFRKFSVELVKLGLVFFFSLLIYAIQFLPAYELTTLSNRKSLNYDEATLSGTLKPFNIFDFVVPNLMTYIKDGYVINLIPSYLYFGITPLILAVLSLFDFKNKGKIFFILTFFIFFIASMGSFTAFYDLIYFSVPGMGKFRNVSKFMYLATLSFSMMAGYGLDRVIYAEKLKLKMIFIPFVLLTGAFFWGGYYYIRTFQLRMGDDGVPDITAFNNSLNTISLSIFFILVSFLILYHLNNLKNKTIYYFLVILIFIDLSTFNNGVQPNNSKINPGKFLDGSQELLRFLQEDKSFYRIHFAYEPAPMHYSPEVYDVYISDGYSSLIIDGISKEINSRKHDKLNFAKELAVAGVKYVISSKDLDYDDINLVHEIKITEDNFLNYYKYGGDGVGMIPRAPTEKLNVYQNNLYKPLKINDFSGELISLTVEKQEGENIVLPFAYYPGWHASASGVEISIEKGIRGQISLKNPKEDLLIDLRYTPKLFYIGLYTTLFSTAILTYLLFKSYQNRKTYK